MAAPVRLRVHETLETLRNRGPEGSPDKRRPLRWLISRGSEANLLRMEASDSGVISVLLERLLALHTLALTPDTIIFPSQLAEPQNRGVLKAAARGIKPLVDLMDGKGVLDFRRAGLTIKTSGYLRAPTFAEEMGSLLKEEALRDAEKSEELGDLALFRLLISAHIDLIITGEVRGLAIVEDERGLSDEKIRSFALGFERILRVFPFGRDDYRAEIAAGLRDAAPGLRRLRTGPASEMLASAVEMLVDKVEEREARRFGDRSAATDTSLDISSEKIRVVNRYRGDCVVTSRGYTKSEGGILHRQLTERNVHFSKLLAMIGHQQASIDEEITRNNEAMETLDRALDPTVKRPEEIIEPVCIMLLFSKALEKRKAYAELMGAFGLLILRTESSRRLAADLISLARVDLERRTAVLERQKASIAMLREHTEAMMRDVLIGVADAASKYFMENASRTNFTPAARRLRVYLGTLLKRGRKSKDKPADPFEKFLKQARSHAYGVLRGLASGVDLQTAAKSARRILEIEFDFINRGRAFGKGQRQAELYDFFHKKAQTYGEGLLAGLKAPKQPFLL